MQQCRKQEQSHQCPHSRILLYYRHRGHAVPVSIMLKRLVFSMVPLMEMYHLLGNLRWRAQHTRLDSSRKLGFPSLQRRKQSTIATVTTSTTTTAAAAPRAQEQQLQCIATTTSATATIRTLPLQRTATTLVDAAVAVAPAAATATAIMTATTAMTTMIRTDGNSERERE